MLEVSVVGDSTVNPYFTVDCLLGVTFLFCAIGVLRLIFFESCSFEIQPQVLLLLLLQQQEIYLTKEENYTVNLYNTIMGLYYNLIVKVSFLLCGA